MSQGTFYTIVSARSTSVKAVINYLNLDVKVEDVAALPNYAELFPLKQSPAFIGPKGLKLTETPAILNYLVGLSDDEKAKATLIGSTEIEKVQVTRWVSLANTTLISSVATPVLSILGARPYNKKQCDAALEKVAVIASIYEARLKEYTFLASEKISLADLHSAGIWAWALKTICGPEFRTKYPAFIRWFKTVTASPAMKSALGDFKFAEKALTYTPPKKEKKAEKPKAQEKPNAQEKPKEEAQPAEKKPKHPLEALGKSTFILDEWKRKYSNEDTRPVALPWFWEHYNPEEYSLWKVDYKYNDELTLTFMSNNLVGGFFNRLSASTKYMFGSAVVYGENNNNGIIGAFLVRGQEHAPAFNVAPDWESYSYTKLDPTKEEDKEFVNNMWAWDKPVVVNGENKEIVDGKVLK